MSTLELPDCVHAYLAGTHRMGELPEHPSGECDDCRTVTDGCRFEYGWVWVTYPGGEKRPRLVCLDCAKGRLRRASRIVGGGVPDPEPFQPPVDLAGSATRLAPGSPNWRPRSSGCDM